MEERKNRDSNGKRKIGKEGWENGRVDKKRKELKEGKNVETLDL